MEVFSEYLKKDHVFARIDARIKLVISLALLVMILSYRGYLFPIIVLFFSIILCLKIKIPIKIFLLRFSEPMFIAFVVTILRFLFAGKEAIFSVDLVGLKVVGYSDGLLDGLKIASRILGAMSVVAVLGFITSFAEIIAGFSWFKIPRGFVDILTFAYHYIFTLLEDATVIYSAQKNRLGYSSIRRGLDSFGALTGSLTLKAFQHSHNITTTMLQRGYDGDIPMLKCRPFKSIEVIASILFMTIMGALWTIK